MPTRRRRVSPRCSSGHRRFMISRCRWCSADYDHAIDVWQWTLRLSAERPGLALQLAALFHDVERLDVGGRAARGARRRRLPGIQERARAAAGPSWRRRCSRRAASIAATRSRTSFELIRGTRAAARRAGPRATRELLADADALSFFSLNSSGFADYYGREHTLKKVRYSLGRMSAGAVRRVPGIRLRGGRRAAARARWRARRRSRHAVQVSA